MSFSAGFLAFIIYGALIWTGLAAFGLTALLARDLSKGDVW